MIRFLGDRINLYPSILLEIEYLVIREFIILYLENYYFFETKLRTFFIFSFMRVGRFCWISRVFL